MPGRAKSPLPSMAGSLILPRPLVAVRITGPSSSWLRDGLLDTGSVETIFEQSVAKIIGVDLTHTQSRQIHLTGRKPLRCRYAPVVLRISDGLKETYEWNAVVGFVNVSLWRPLLGYAGFLQYFDADSHGCDTEVILKPNRAFAGNRI